MTKLTVNDCELCNADAGEVLWRDAFCRVVLVADQDYPGFCRVILNDHIAEMTHLEPRDRDRLMQVVFSIEAVLRELMSPTKINLASLGNKVPHLHWHVIPRFSDDRHFPDAVWAEPRRAHAARPNAPDARTLSSRLRDHLG